MTGTGLRFEDGRLFLMHQDGTETELHRTNEIPDVALTTPPKPEKDEPLIKIDSDGITINCGIDYANTDDVQILASLMPKFGKTFWEKCIEEKKEGNNMEIMLVRMYTEKSRDNINSFYDMLKKNETEKDIVKKEFDELIDKFNEDITKLADKYNPYNGVNGTYIVENECGDFEIPYSLFHDSTEKEKEIEKMRTNELNQLDEKVLEVNAHLSLISDDDAFHYESIMTILRSYGIVNDRNKLTPYMPTFKEECNCGEECPCKETKRRGRPKKENK